MAVLVHCRACVFFADHEERSGHRNNWALGKWSVGMCCHRSNGFSTETDQCSNKREMEWVGIFIEHPPGATLKCPLFCAYN